MKNLLLSITVILLGVSSTWADVLIDMNLNEGSGTTAGNAGTLPDGVIASSGGGRPLPSWDSPGVNNTGSSVGFDYIQTGRPGFFQAIDISSSGMNNLSAFTISYWWKSVVPTTVNPGVPSNPGRMTVFATRDSTTNSAAGIQMGFSGEFATTGGTAPQVEFSMGDGTNGGRIFGAFSPTSNVGLYDDSWNFLALTFDGAAVSNKVQIYSGNEVDGVVLNAVFNQFDLLTSTGVSAAGLISIGDGLNGFSAWSSFSGDLDNIYVTDTALDLSELEALRLSAIPEPATGMIIFLSGVALICLRRRPTGIN